MRIFTLDGELIGESAAGPQCGPHGWTVLVAKDDGTFAELPLSHARHAPPKHEPAKKETK